MRPWPPWRGGHRKPTCSTLEPGRDISRAATSARSPEGTGSRTITPLVKVPAADSLVWEGSCGSGSLAAAAVQGRPETLQHHAVAAGAVAQFSVDPGDGGAAGGNLSPNGLVGFAIGRCRSEPVRSGRPLRPGLHPACRYNPSPQGNPG